MSTFRPARAIDAPELIEILESHYAASRFAGLGNVDRDYTRKLLAQASCRHGHTNDGGCWFEVMTSERGIEAFMLGTLQRAYMIGDKLVAQDVLFIARPGANQRAAFQLIDHYVAWAQANPRCIEACVSWTDVLPGTERMDAVYRRKDFIECGAVYRLSPRGAASREAA